MRKSSRTGLLGWFSDAMDVGFSSGGRNQEEKEEEGNQYACQESNEGLQGMWLEMRAIMPSQMM